MRSRKASLFAVRFSAPVACVFLLMALALSALPGMASGNLPKYIDEYDVPTRNSAPLAITADRNGIIWFTESNATKLGRFDPATKTFKEYAVPGIGDMWGITVDQSGYVWLTQYSGKGSTNPGGAIVPGGHGRLLRFSPATGNFSIVDLPSEGSFPFRVIVDEQGRVWFTEILGNKIGVYDPASNRLEEYDVPSYFSGPADLAFDGRGSLWLTEAYNESLARFQLATRSFVEYHLSTTDPARFIASPVGIAVSENGDIWFADHGGNWIAEFDPVSQALTRYPAGPIPGYSYSIAIPNGLLIDGQGRVWFSEHWGNRIGYFDPRSQTMVEFSIPTGPISTALWITLAPNGDVWFTEWASNKLGVLHASLPVPFSLSISKDLLQLAAGQEASLPFSAKATQELEGNGTLRYSWSSYEPNDVQVTFTPQSYPPFTSLAETSGEAKIRVSSRVSPGNYTLSIGIDAGPVLMSRMLHVEVTQAKPTSVLPSPDILLLLVGVLASVLAGLLVRRRLTSPTRPR